MDTLFLNIDGVLNNSIWFKSKTKNEKSLAFEENYKLIIDIYACGGLGEVSISTLLIGEKLCIDNCKALPDLLDSIGNPDIVLTHTSRYGVDILSKSALKASLEKEGMISYWNMIFSTIPGWNSDKHRVKDMLPMKGYPFEISLWHPTPETYRHPEYLDRGIGLEPHRSTRADIIHAYILENNYRAQHDDKLKYIKDYMILDSEYEVRPLGYHRFIHVNPKFGLNNKVIRKAISLNKNEPPMIDSLITSSIISQKKTEFNKYMIEDLRMLETSIYDRVLLRRPE